MKKGSITMQEIVGILFAIIVILVVIYIIVQTQTQSNSITDGIFRLFGR